MPIQVFHDVGTFRRWREYVAGHVAFVPTMGALHAGHVALCQHALKLAPTVVASVYVNPLQFGPGEDFSQYPRTLPSDIQLLDDSNVSAVFCPPDLGEASSQVRVMAGSLARELCGASRPGHFDGVLTVLTKLFNIVRPDIAVFGEKDYQQCAVVSQWCRETYNSCVIKIHSIVRESSGLAMSSRNRRLSPDGIKRAALLNTAIQAVQKIFSGGESSALALEKCARDALKGVEIEYCDIRDGSSLSKVLSAKATDRIFIAGRVEGVRLIDNGALGAPSPILR